MNWKDENTKLGTSGQPKFPRVWRLKLNFNLPLSTKLCFFRRLDEGMEGEPQATESMVIAGLDDDYVHVDSAEKLEELRRQEELQLMPTQTMKDPFSLTPAATSEVTLRNTATLDEIALSMGPSEPSLNSDLGSMEQRPLPGKTANFLESKGFGWLLEVEDQEDFGPLL